MEKRKGCDTCGHGRSWVPLGDPPLSVLYLAAAIVLEICGTTALKLSQGFTQIGPAGIVVL
jgi:hypothetical protein